MVASFSIYLESLHSILMKTSNLQLQAFHKMSMIFLVCHAGLRHAHNNSMNHTIKPDHFTYSNHHIHALPCDFDVMSIGKTSLKHLNAWFFVIVQMGGGCCLNCLDTF